MFGLRGRHWAALCCFSTSSTSSSDSLSHCYWLSLTLACFFSSRQPGQSWTSWHPDCCCCYSYNSWQWEGSEVRRLGNLTIVICAHLRLSYHGNCYLYQFIGSVESVPCFRCTLRGCRTILRFVSLVLEFKRTDELTFAALMTVFCLWPWILLYSARLPHLLPSSQACCPIGEQSGSMNSLRFSSNFHQRVSSDLRYH